MQSDEITHCLMLDQMFVIDREPTTSDLLLNKIMSYYFGTYLY